MSPRTVLLTGASRGIGLAIAQKLLREKHNVVLVARTAGPLEELKKQYPEQVEVVVGDLSDFKVCFRGNFWFSGLGPWLASTSKEHS